jgi:small subunit ribosomal protein S6
MNKYEIVFVLQADEPETEMAAHVQKVDDLVKEFGGEITERNHWGVRQLAYEIRHQTRGNYMHIRFSTGGDAIRKMDTEFRLDHKILRHLIVVDEQWKERNEANQAKRRRPAAEVETYASPAPARPAAPVESEAPAETE